MGVCFEFFFVMFCIRIKLLRWQSILNIKCLLRFGASWTYSLSTFLALTTPSPLPHRCPWLEWPALSCFIHGLFSLLLPLFVVFINLFIFYHFIFNPFRKIYSIPFNAESGMCILLFYFISIWFHFFYVLCSTQSACVCVCAGKGSLTMTSE